MSTTQFIAVLLSWTVCFAATPGRNAGSPIQESARDLGEQRTAGKFLTSGEIDTWVFHAEANETLVVRVTTNEFDAIVGLARVDDGKDDVLFSNDDEGSNSRFCYRIRNAGKYKIRVHGYEMKGGGNYQLAVERFQPQPIKIGKAVTKNADENGHADFFFDGEPGQWVTLVGSHGGRLYDPDGEFVQPGWGGSYLIARKGEYLVRTKGIEGRVFTFEVRPAVVGSLKSGESKSYKSKGGTLHNWEIDAQKGQFALITVSRKRNPASRILFAPPNDPNEKQLDSKKNLGPEIKFLPVASKGKSTVYAAVFGRTGKFLLQTQAGSEANVDIEMNDPTIDLDSLSIENAQLNIGAAGYYGFDASAGDLVKFSLRSDAFDPVLRLFDGNGSLVSENDDFGDSTNSEIECLVPQNGYYRWQVVSLGDGGGGDYEFDFMEIPRKKIAIGQVASGNLEDGSADYWSSEIESGKSVYLNVRSSRFTPEVVVYNSTGGVIARSSNGLHNESLIPLSLSWDARVTISVSSSGNGGKYDIRVIDAAWDEDK